MTRRIGKSDSQANAEALVRRAAPYSTTHSGSVAANWHYETRYPSDLRGMVKAVRRAYADEVPERLHEGPDSIGEGGTPRMTEAALRYLDAPFATDAPKGERPLVSHYTTPFRAALDRMEHHPRESQRKRAAIVRHITIGGTDETAAAEREGVPSWCADIVASDALRVFLNRMTDLKVDLRPEEAA